jgi:hypothetical protein
MRKARGPRFPWTIAHSWVGAVELAVAIGIACFLVSRLDMIPRDEPEGFAVFSPAADVAIGAVIGLGSTGRLPVAAGGALPASA